MNCFVCNKAMDHPLYWTQLFMPPLNKPLCESCESKLELIRGKRCEKCCRQCETKICSDCERWEQSDLWNGVLQYNYSVYHYNSMLQELIANWKYRGDYVLREIFRESFKEAFETCFYSIKQTAVLVPIPLSEERAYERGFNQAEALAQLLGIPYRYLLSRRHGEKQSKRTRQQRLTSINPFEIITPVKQPVILIDDIYTTGITVRHAAYQLKQHGTPIIYSFTLSRG